MLDTGRFAAHLRHAGIAEWRGRQNPVPDAGPFLLWIYAGHLHPRYGPDAGASSGEDRTFHGDGDVGRCPMIPNRLLPFIG